MSDWNNDRMLEIPAGEIILRDDRIDRVWTVKIKSFFLSPYPVTQKRYFDLTALTPSSFIGDNRPVENISWIEAIKFCNLLSDEEGFAPYYLFNSGVDNMFAETGSEGYRLPTEAEWEYSCKAGTTGTRYGELKEIAWFRENSNGSTQEVGGKEANNWGVYDMLGNVWEWCSDIYDETVYGSYRIIRGGGWNDEARGCLATNRRRSHPSAFKIDDLGFRVARNIKT